MKKKHRFTLKQDRQAGHIASSMRKQGKTAGEAKSIGYATVNKLKSKKHDKRKVAKAARKAMGGY